MPLRPLTLTVNPSLVSFAHTTHRLQNIQQMACHVKRCQMFWMPIAADKPMRQLATVCTVYRLDWSVDYWHCSRSMRSRVYETVERPSVHLSVCPVIGGVRRVCCWARAGRRCRSTAAAVGQRRRSTALSSKREECHVDMRCRNLNTESNGCSCR